MVTTHSVSGTLSIILRILSSFSLFTGYVIGQKNLFE